MAGFLSVSKRHNTCLRARKTKKKEVQIKVGETKWQDSKSMATGMIAVLVSVTKHRRQSKAQVQREAEEVSFGHTENEASSEEVKGRQGVWQ